MIQTPPTGNHSTGHSSAYVPTPASPDLFQEPPPARLTFQPTRNPGWQSGLNPLLAANLPETLPYIVAVGGGKGGVGKSMLAANLAIHLQQNGFRCLALDMDLGSSNLHTYFGLAKPATNLSDAFQQTEISFQDLVSQTSLDGLYLINAGELPALRQIDDAPYAERFQWFFSNLFCCQETLGIDFIILDLGAGNHSLTMDFFALAHLGLVVSHAEVTSLENAYAFLKAHLWQIYENVVKGSDHAADLTKFRYLFQKFKPQRSIQQGGGYGELLQKINLHYPDLGQRIADGLLARKIGLVMNQARAHTDAKIGLSMEEISRSYFGLPAHHLATLNNDDLAWKALRSRTSLVQFAPYSLLSRHIKALADQLLKQALEDQTSWTN